MENRDDWWEGAYFVQSHAPHTADTYMKCNPWHSICLVEYRCLNAEALKEQAT